MAAAVSTLFGVARPFVVAEIGLNHNGRLDLAERLIEKAREADVDCVKFQKRSLGRREYSAGLPRTTPLGQQTNLAHRRTLELTGEEFEVIDDYCRQLSIPWFASSWDEEAVDFLEAFNVPYHKLPSARLGDEVLLGRLHRQARPVIIGTGMATFAEVQGVVRYFKEKRDFVLVHTTSSYPAPAREANLRVIEKYRRAFGCRVGYSDHTTRAPVVLAAVALGIDYLEFHITLDRGMWGTDHVASWQPDEARELVRRVREVAFALGDGEKVVQRSERMHAERLARRSL